MFPTGFSAYYDLQISIVRPIGKGCEVCAQRKSPRNRCEKAEVLWIDGDHNAPVMSPLSGASPRVQNDPGSLEQSSPEYDTEKQGLGPGYQHIQTHSAHGFAQEDVRKEPET